MAKCQEVSPIISSRQISGIYLLLLKDEVVYVGKSTSILSRVYAHLSDKKKRFDSFTFLEFPVEELQTKEQEYYLKYLPVHNLVPPLAGPKKKFYSKTSNTVACRKWRQKNKWILKMKARERRAKKKKSNSSLAVTLAQPGDGQSKDMATSSSDSPITTLLSIPNIKRGCDL